MINEQSISAGVVNWAGYGKSAKETFEHFCRYHFKAMSSQATAEVVFREIIGVVSYHVNVGFGNAPIGRDECVSQLRSLLPGDGTEKYLAELFGDKLGK